MIGHKSTDAKKEADKIMTAMTAQNLVVEMRAKLRPTRSKPSLHSHGGLVVPKGRIDAGSEQAREGREDTFDVTRPRDILHLYSTKVANF